LPRFKFIFGLQQNLPMFESAWLRVCDRS
jgi:hypothetical protein